MNKWRENIWEKEFDVDALAALIDPDWRDHFLSPHMTIDFYAEFMPKREFDEYVKESQ